MCHFPLQLLQTHKMRRQRGSRLRLVLPCCLERRQARVLVHGVGMHGTHQRCLNRRVHLKQQNEQWEQESNPDPEVPQAPSELIACRLAGLVWAGEVWNQCPIHATVLSPVLCVDTLSLIHISEPTRLLSISYAVFCLKKKKQRMKL
eukprot:TRINITY_DN6429_c0_g1_i3.p1 TRINITY_DN6429_c0_g1~~TRINITY_DN6429_c0_g1_i3.p1  ORF type:complete len:147 (+),score=21.68 TRINITY_DN6429_c0_g1_i3:473-913(+)